MDRNDKITIGLDVGDRTTWLCALDSSGEVVLQDRFRTGEPGLRRTLGKLPRSCVALEVGRHSPWMSRALTTMGHEVIVANPRRVRLITSTERKNDRLDAEKLARLARVDPSLLHPIQHRRADTSAALATIRSREQVVRARTRLINSVRAQVVAVGGSLPAGKITTFHTQLELIPEQLRDALAPMLRMVGACTEEINAYDRVLEDMAREVYPETEVLQQIWGVGFLTALTFVLVIEVPERFKKSRDVGAYLGLVPRQDQSGAVDKQLSITKTGDRLMRKLLVQCAHRVLCEKGPDTDLKRWGLKLAARGGASAKKRALVGVARKLAVLLHRLWVSGEIYEPLRHAERELELSA